MKRLIMLFGFIVLICSMTNESQAAPAPYYIKIRVGFFARWSVAIGDCKPGWGICISITDGPSQNFLGFNPESDELLLKISKSSPEAKEIRQGTIEVQEDSPVDPLAMTRLSNFRPKDKTVIIKRGVYKAVDLGDSYQFVLKYSVQ